MGRPRIHDDNTRERLFRAAEAMVAEGGVESLSVRQLARMAKTTTRAVYSVFGGREGIVRALYRESMVIMMQGVAQVPISADPVEDLVRAGVDAFRAFAQSRPNLYRLVFENGHSTAHLTRDDLALATAARAELRRRVQRCADAGLLGGRSADVVTNQFHATCQGLASAELVGWFERVDDPVFAWEDALRSQLRGMAQPSRASKPKASSSRKRGPRR